MLLSCLYELLVSVDVAALSQSSALHYEMHSARLPACMQRGIYCLLVNRITSHTPSLTCHTSSRLWLPDLFQARLVSAAAAALASGELLQLMTSQPSRQAFCKLLQLLAALPAAA
jgi:hypothetical protein